MHLDQWLKQVHDEEISKEASGLEATFDQMDPSTLLDIACGRTTIEKAASAKGFLSKHKDKITGALAAAPLSATTGYLAGTAKGFKEGKEADKNKAASAKLAFMDKVAREIARQHYEVAKAASGYKQEKKDSGMIKKDEFTSPEAQQKAKLMQRSMKVSKGAPPAVRKQVIKQVGKKI